MVNVIHAATKALSMAKLTDTVVVHCKSSLHEREFGAGSNAAMNNAYLDYLVGCGVLASEMKTAGLFIQSQLYNHQISQAGEGVINRVLCGAILSSDIKIGHTALADYEDIRTLVHSSNQFPSYTSNPSVLNYLIELGAGIGLHYNAYTQGLLPVEIQDELISSPAYPTQLFIGAQEKLLQYFREKGYYQNRIDSIEKFLEFNAENKLSEDDKNRLITQAHFAINSNIFNKSITRDLACILGHLLYPDLCFKDFHILETYIDYFNALLIAYHEKSAMNQDSNGIPLLRMILQTGIGLNANDFSKLLDATEAVNLGIRLRR